MLYKLLFFKAIISILLCQPTLAASYYGSGLNGDVGAGIRYDDNISRAELGSDIEYDLVSILNGRLGYQTVIDSHSLLNFSASIVFERMEQFKSLNNVRLSGSVDYFYQAESGIFKPWFNLNARISELKFNKSNIRDSQLLDVKVGVGKRFTSNFTAIASYKYQQRFSEEKVFDLVNNGLNLDLEYQYSKLAILYTNYQFAVGEVVSTAIPNSRIISAAETVAPDDVFSPGTGPGCTNRRCAYRLDAITHNIGAGLNLNFGENTVFDFATQYHHSDAAGDNQYQGLIYHANLWYVF